MRALGYILILLSPGLLYIAYLQQDIYASAGIALLSILLVVLGILIVFRREKEKEEKKPPKQEKIICPSCKREVEGGGKFCGHCGERL